MLGINMVQMPRRFGLQQEVFGDEGHLNGSPGARFTRAGGIPF